MHGSCVLGVTVLGSGVPGTFVKGTMVQGTRVLDPRDNNNGAGILYEGIVYTVQCTGNNYTGDR